MGSAGERRKLPQWGLGQSLSRQQFLLILGLIQAFSDNVLELSMDLYDRATYKFEGGIGVLYYELSDFARVAAPCMHSAYVKNYNMKREKYVVIKFYVSNV